MKRTVLITAAALMILAATAMTARALVHRSATVPAAVTACSRGMAPHTQVYNGYGIPLPDGLQYTRGIPLPKVCNSIPDKDADQLGPALLSLLKQRYQG